MSDPAGEFPPQAVRAVAEILRCWEVDRSGEPVDPVEEFDIDARELLEAAAPLLADQARAAGAAEERARIAETLRHLGDWPDGHADFRALVERHRLYSGDRPAFSKLLLALAELVERGDDA
ncbi:hypothetical protein Sme01_03580 [Sphaerisporangium melleum]|uniref:Uncharacterized protein n=1 Tax=Sphaerisporangium melleum TaxID=321316 RepID=A0A917QP25_9ACTN|nr:hypothetical protein [Sphaerisporangium melleum]GGK61737.1 hypothetical protein GCM10007964_01130 [Sphaerisporangium melleum]GII67882.1 hypothetical protein Sme01_03580 [Sphaerisporangium melleum]